VSILSFACDSCPDFVALATLTRLHSSRRRSTTLVFWLLVCIRSTSYRPQSLDPFHAGYTQALRPGVKASFGLALDTQKLNDASHQGPIHKVSPDIRVDEPWFSFRSFVGWLPFRFRVVNAFVHDAYAGPGPVGGWLCIIFSPIPDTVSIFLKFRTFLSHSV
jgi:hypothetical protein